MSLSILNRLPYNFDTTKFNKSEELSANTTNILNIVPKKLKNWQKQAISEGPIDVSDYYRDPTATVVANLETQVNSIKSIINGIEFWDNNSGVGQSANTLYNTFSNSTITYFKKHTSNISGLTTSLITGAPDHGRIIGTNQGLIFILNETEGSANANALPILGCMTSLFVNDEIVSNTAIIASDIITLQNSLRNEVDPTYGYTNVYSSLSSVGVDALYAHALTANNLLWDRRTHDFNYYQSASSVISDYMKVSALASVGDTQKYLINNYIGTDLYKESLLSD
jgi:hypothetical protein